MIGSVDTSAARAWAASTAVRRNALLFLYAALAVTGIAGWAFKAHCLSGGVWYDLIQYRTGCYTDVIPFWSLRGVAAGQVPYIEARIEYPVLTGALIWLEGLLTRTLFDAAAISTAFLTVVAIVNLAFAFVVLDMLRRFGVPRARLWAWAASPLLVVYMAHNWDMMAVALSIGALLMARNGRLVPAALLAGLGASAKLYPALLVPLLCLQALLVADQDPLSRRFARSAAVGAAGLGAWIAVNAPIAWMAFDNWLQFYQFSAQRSTTAASIWEILGGHGLVTVSHEGRNTLATGLVVAGSAAIAALGWRRHARHAWTLFTPILIWFVFVNKVYSPQFDLWIYPLLLLTIRRRAPIVIFAAGSLLAFISELWFFAGQEGAAFSAGRWAIEVSALIRATGMFWAMASAIFEPAPHWISGEGLPGGSPGRRRRGPRLPAWVKAGAGPLSERTGLETAGASAYGGDPLPWCMAIAALFAACCSYGLLSPASLYFDETHYIPAARSLLQLVPANEEHPLLAKEIMAASIATLGDRAMGWRLPSLLIGTLGLFAFSRLMWWTSRRRFATIAGTILLATNFMWFIQSRIAMLDIFAAALLIVALWQFAAALAPETRRPNPRLAATGLCLGLSLGAKWSVAPFVALPALVLTILGRRDSAARRNGVPADRAGAKPLVLAVFWLGIVPLIVYWLTFAPAFFYASPASAIQPYDIVGQHLKMVALQASATGSHPNQSAWHEWVMNTRPVWYLYEEIDGAQRGVLMLGNPFTMLAGLAGLAWCIWAGLARKRADALALSAAYLIAVAFWIAAAKPVQFYYHYLLPGAFLMGCLALALDALFAKGGRRAWLAPGAVAASVAMFAWFYPIISAIPLSQGGGAFQAWMWLDSWR
ncbi:MAG TPA: glycosyltransferase 87 family protein [Novosphingobium sp.]|nr:glycosyltransferase 87 family protein [Novosphingobium sp.]